MSDMIKFKVVHRETDQQVEVYRIVDILSQFGYEIRNHGFMNTFRSKKCFDPVAFADIFGIKPFMAYTGSGRPCWCVVASKFDEYIIKYGWKQNSEHGCVSNLSKPETKQTHDRLQIKGFQRDRDLSAEFIDRLDHLLMTLFDAKFKESVNDIGESIAEKLLRELPSIMFNQMQGGISRLIEIKIAEQLEKATSPEGGVV